MTQIRLVARLNEIIARPPTTTPELYRALGMVLGVLGLGLLAAGLYLAPKPATLGLVLLGLGLPLVFLLWHRPELGLLALIFLTSSLVPADVVDLRLPIGGGLDLRDLVLIGILGLLILRGLSHKALSVPWWRVGTPLLLFLGFALFSTLYALFYQHVKPNWVFSDLRVVLFYCVFFVTGWSVTNRRQLVTVLIGLFFLADLLAGVLILQQFLGMNHPLLAAMSYSNWRIYAEKTSGSGSFGMVRIMPPGVVLVYFVMIAAFCLMIFTPHSRHLRIIFALQFVYLNFGLLLTYTRALWIAAASALGLVLIVLFPVYKAHLIRYLVIGLPFLGLLFGLLGAKLEQSISNSELASASIERVLSILTPGKTLESDSLQWRIFETEEGLRSVSQHLLLGVGLGNSYRRVTTFQGESRGIRTGHSLAAGEISSLTRFVHNSYLSIAVKMGLPALACFLWFCVSLVVNSGQLFKNLSDEQLRAIALAVLAGFVGLMLWSIFHQHFIQTESTAIVGLMAGLAASLPHTSDGQSGLQQPSHRASARLRS
jgi:hypothetical protein